MAPARTTLIGAQDPQKGSIEQLNEQLSELFGSYKAEHLKDRIFDLYTRPSYFPQLETDRPCILVGGRGTGKTTVLRSLSYEGRYELLSKQGRALNTWPYYGFYLKVDTNKVTAFSGPDLRGDTWAKLFAHYINYLLCTQALKFLNWYSDRLPNAPTLAARQCRTIALSLRISNSSSVQELGDNLEQSRIEFEAFLNNLRQDTLPAMSMQESPIEELFKAISSLPQFMNKKFFFLVDEYENFLNDQQIIMNTLIKHSGPYYTFKIGVRELGWRVRNTLNANEQLTSPADYALISIRQKLHGGKFAKFASDIVNQRLQSLPPSEAKRFPTIEKLLPDISDNDEARKLGIDEKLSAMLRAPHYSAVDRRSLRRLPPLEAYFLLSRITNQRSLKHLVKQRMENPTKWRTSFENYKYSLLFTIKKGKPGIRKYYAGWKTFLLLADCNIRYLIELVDQTLLLEAETRRKIGRSIRPETQTRAAQDVGGKNLGELEGLSTHGAQLKKLALGLGRIFQVMAQQAGAHAPEVNQFHIAENSELTVEAEDLIKAGIMHLALVRNMGSKLLPDETKEYDYGLHPIFSPFFGFSHRKKRKMLLRPEDLLGLIRAPGLTIKKVLEDNNRIAAEPLPTQLTLFGTYYGQN